MYKRYTRRRKATYNKTTTPQPHTHTPYNTATAPSSTHARAPWERNASVSGDSGDKKKFCELHEFDDFGDRSVGSDPDDAYLSDEGSTGDAWSDDEPDDAGNGKCMT